MESVLELKNVTHFQAAAMLARGLFELAVDMRLLEVTPHGWLKMLAFVDVEKLRSARKIVKFAKSHQTQGAEISTFESFIATRENQIDNKQRILWPTLRTVEHWSGVKLFDRVKQLGDPFDAIYEAQYPRLSWSVHSGLTGIVNLKAEAFAHMCADAFKLSAEAYCEVLRVIIRRFSLTKVNEHIESNLNVAKLFPFADTPEEVDSLTRAIRRPSHS